MTSRIETGHAKNVANFENLIIFCAGYGADYNPANQILTLDSLRTTFTEAKTALANVNTQLPVYVNTVNRREELFAPLKTLATRITNAVEASEANKELTKNVKVIVRRLQGRRATSKKERVASVAVAKQDGSTTRNHSVSQMSFDQRIHHLDELIQLLASQPGYAPNEKDLSVAGLTTYLEELRKANTEEVNAEVSLSNTRRVRNTLLYAEDTGLISVAANIKKYVKSVFGAVSPQYKQIRAIEFRKMNT